MASMRRYLEKYIKEDLASKIVMLTGPRQTGKTTLSKLVTPDYDYFNLDNPEHRLNWHLPGDWARGLYRINIQDQG